jgi:hypothetical protein
MLEVLDDGVMELDPECFATLLVHTESLDQCDNGLGVILLETGLQEDENALLRLCPHGLGHEVGLREHVVDDGDVVEGELYLCNIIQLHRSYYAAVVVGV